MVTYIHAADLHLDAPFVGLSKSLIKSEPLAKELKLATFKALDRLEKFCLEQKPDFLLLAGDLTNSEEQSIRARLRLVSLCEHLRACDIPVFIIHGNHDPKLETFKSITFPDNVTIFGSEVEVAKVEKQGETIALIYGVSHAKRGDNRNLSSFFKRDPSLPKVLQLGLMHTALKNLGSQDEAQPTSLKELKATGLDAWALGHIHKPTLVQDKEPMVLYAGSLQGLNCDEPSEHGCYLVKAWMEEDTWQFKPSFHSLAPVIFQSLELNLSEMVSLEQVLHALEQRLEDLRGTLPPNCRLGIVKIILQGATPLWRELQGKGEELKEALELDLTATPPLFISQIETELKSTINVDTYLQRDDLLGYCLNLAKQLESQDSKALDFISKTLNPLFGHSQLKKILPPLEASDLDSLLKDAAKLCISKLED
ncbi:MAG: DNA repair exonuclease [Desulfovibrionaceae bacterium]|nr:DNA repair exonuclease [Desulfovibrionaceae bacterium]